MSGTYSESNTVRVRSSALAWASLGYEVLPLYGMVPGEGGRLVCSCGEACRTPGQHSWVRTVDEATTDSATIERWWTERPESNLAVQINGSFRLVSGLHDSPRRKRSSTWITPTRATNDLYAGALDLAQDGMRVFRVCGIVMNEDGILVADCRKSPCESPGKHPLDTGWQESATTDPDMITRWWAEWPTANVGILTGDGIMAIDLDQPSEKNGLRDGHVIWDELQERYGQVPPTRTSVTGSVGHHLLFRTNRSHGNSLPVLKPLGLAGVIDTRGKDSGFIVAPPSRHENGRHYQWVDATAPIADAPDWFYDVPEEAEPPTPSQDRTHEQPESQAPTKTTKRAAKALSRVEQDAERLLQAVDPDARLTRNTLDLIRNGDPDGDQSAIVQSIARGAAAVSYDPEKLYALLADPENTGGLGLQRRIQDDGVASAHAWLYRTMRTAHRYRAEAIASIRKLRAEVKKYEFPTTIKFTGRNGKDQAVQGKKVKPVLEAAFTIATKWTTTAPMIGIPQLHEITGFGEGTCLRAVQALEHLGWWTVTDESHGKQDAYIYSFILDPESREHPPRTVQVHHQTSRFPMPTLGEMSRLDATFCQLPLMLSQWRRIFMNQATPVVLTRPVEQVVIGPACIPPAPPVPVEVEP